MRIPVGTIVGVFTPDRADERFRQTVLQGRPYLARCNVEVLHLSAHFPLILKATTQTSAPTVTYSSTAGAGVFGGLPKPSEQDGRSD